MTTTNAVRTYVSVTTTDIVILARDRLTSRAFFFHAYESAWTRELSARRRRRRRWRRQKRACRQLTRLTFLFEPPVVVRRDLPRVRNRWFSRFSRHRIGPRFSAAFFHAYVRLSAVSDPGSLLVFFLSFNESHRSTAYVRTLCV